MSSDIELLKSLLKLIVVLRDAIRATDIRMMSVATLSWANEAERFLEEIQKEAQSLLSRYPINE